MIPTKLSKLIEQAYQLFSSYKLDEKLAVCTQCCFSEKNAALLRSIPLPEISPPLMFQYLDSIFYDNNLQVLINETKYLLPRILELMAQRAFISNNEELILKRCHCSDTRFWKKAEIDFLQEFALEFFEWKLLNPDQEGLEDIQLLVFHLAGLDITPLLNNWLKNSHDQHAAYSFMGMQADFILNGFLFDVEYDDKIILQVKVWLRSDDVRERFRDSLSIQLNRLGNDKSLLNSHYQLVIAFLSLPTSYCGLLSGERGKLL